MHGTGLSNAKNELRRVNTEDFKHHFAAEVDRGEPVAITRKGKVIGTFIPAHAPFPPEPDEIEPEPEQDDETGPVVLHTVSADAGPHLHVLWTSDKLSLPELFDAD